MRAVVQRAFGGPEVLVIEDAPLPDPAPGEVRVRVAAAGVHAVDLDIRRGESPPSMPTPVLPMTPGREVAGTVDALGEGVDPSWLGVAVVAHVGFRSGGYAEFVLSPAESLHRIPDGVTSAQAVAAIGTGRTAQLVLEDARIRPDDVVIVPGASGGLGSQLAHLALSLGATVVALYGGPAKRAVVEGLSDEQRFIALDAAEEDWPARMSAALDGRTPTLLLDGVGGAVGRAALEALGRGGRVVIIGWSSGEPTHVDTQDILARSLTVGSALGRPIASLRSLEERALAAVAAGHVTPPVVEFPLERAAEAHRAIEQRRQRGKIVLVP